jgi:hypothetical protein
MGGAAHLPPLAACLAYYEVAFDFTDKVDEKFHALYGTQKFTTLLICLCSKSHELIQHRHTVFQDTF